MAVLIEAISVVTRASAIEARYPGGWAQFEADAPNQTLAADGELVRVGFMDPREVQAFVEGLKRHGLRFDVETQPSDICVVDQLNGKTSACEWLAVVEGPVDGDDSHKVTAAMLVGGKSEGLFTPDGWTYEGSMSAEPMFVPSEDVSRRLQFLRTEGGADVYWDNEWKREVFKPHV